MISGKVRAKAERLMPVTYAVLAAATAGLLLLVGAGGHEVNRGLLQAAITAAAIVAAGVAVAQVVVGVMPENHLLRFLQSHGGVMYRRFVGFGGSAVRWSAALVGFSCLGLVLGDSAGGGWMQVGALVWWAVVGGTIGAFVRYFRIVRMVLER